MNPKAKHDSPIKSRLVKFGAISVVAATLSIAVAITTAANSTQETLSANAAQNLVAQNQTTVAFSGTFVAAEAPTTGTAQVVETDGQRYLVLDSAFSTTDQAPDLHVVLETSDRPPANYSDFGTFVNLGKLQNVKGEQRYPIPDAINLSQFKSVAIWCRMANATMGYATLGGASNAGTVRQ
jgi:hypothetical protein